MPLLSQAYEFDFRHSFIWGFFTIIDGKEKTELISSLEGVRYE
jgi:hypothetical protein